jgi:hypothetical protein
MLNTSLVWGGGGGFRPDRDLVAPCPAASGDPDIPGAGLCERIGCGSKLDQNQRNDFLDICRLGVLEVMKVFARPAMPSLLRLIYFLESHEGLQFGGLGVFQRQSVHLDKSDWITRSNITHWGKLPLL